MDIKEAIEELVLNAEMDLMNETDEELTEAKDIVKYWINSPSCPLVDEDEIEE